MPYIVITGTASTAASMGPPSGVVWRLMSAYAYVTGTATVTASLLISLSPMSQAFYLGLINLLTTSTVLTQSGSATGSSLSSASGGSQITAPIYLVGAVGQSDTIAVTITDAAAAGWELVFEELIP